MSVSIKYKGNEIASMDASGTKTLQTSGKYCEADIVVENTESGGSDHTEEDAIITRSISGSYTNDRVTTIGPHAFNSCNDLTLAAFSNATTISAYAFANCSALKVVVCPKATTIGSSAFSSCASLIRADFPLVTSALSAAFSKCTNLNYVNLPKITTVTTNLFAQCTGLTTIDLHNVRTIGTTAFNGCSTLVAIILRKTDGICTMNGTTALNGTPISKDGTGYIYVPAAMVDRYKAYSNWSSFADQIRAIEDYPEITGG